MPAERAQRAACCRAGAIVAIHMEQPGLDHPFALDLRGRVPGEVALPEDGSLPCLFVHQNKRGLALAIRHDDPMGLDPGLSHFVLLQDSRRIVADLSDVAGLQVPSARKR